MKNNQKRLLAAVLCALLSFSTSITPLAEEYAVDSQPIDFYKQEKTSTEPTTQELEAVILSVKELIDIPEQLSEFTWHYSAQSRWSSGGWSLNWHSADENYEEIDVFCDSLGRIKSYNYYCDSSNDKMPKYKKAELIPTAQEFIKRLAPQANFVFERAEDASGKYSRGYSYYFKRVENGIDYPENSARVIVDHKTGTPMSCSITYDYDIAVNAATEIIEAQTALSTYAKAQKMQLYYTLNTKENPDGTINNHAVLVYRPTVGYISVDAKNGKVYYQKSEVVQDKNSLEYYFDTAEAEEASDAGGSRNAAKLSEKELEQLEILEKLITKEEAIKKITSNPVLYLDMALTETNARLSKTRDYSKYSYSYKGNVDKYVWNISFSSTKSTSQLGYYAYANATVDAQTGEILSFRSSIPGMSYYEQGAELPQNRFTNQQCKEIFESFAKASAADKFSKTELSSENQANVVEYVSKDNGLTKEPVYSAYSFRYIRKNDGIDFAYDSFNGGVDAISGKIYSYNYSWTENLTFDSVKDAITPEAALTEFAMAGGFDTYYERYDAYLLNPDEAKTPEEKFRSLVMGIKQEPDRYQELIDKYASGIDKAAIKKLIDSKDEQGIIKLCAEFFEVEAPDSYYFYNSIDELYSKYSVARLVYKPIESVTIGAISGKRVSYNGEIYEKPYDGEITDVEGHWANHYIVMLSNLGIIKRVEKYCPDEYITNEQLVEMLENSYLSASNENISENVTRLEAVKLAVKALGYDKIAKIQKIYKTDFADNPEVDEADIGYLAIAWGVGLIDGYASTNTFRPNQQITKAEAAKLVYRTLEASF